MLEYIIVSYRKENAMQINDIIHGFAVIGKS